MKFKLNDTVKITLGKDKGRTGKIEKIFPKTNKVLITGINQFKKHLKTQDQSKPGGIIDLTKPINIAKIALICPACKKQTRIGYQGLKKKKVRICKKCQKPILTKESSTST
jgi:large subunit ribosomal protein L24